MFWWVPLVAAGIGAAGQVAAGAASGRGRYKPYSPDPAWLKLLEDRISGLMSGSVAPSYLPFVGNVQPGGEYEIDMTLFEKMGAEGIDIEQLVQDIGRRKQMEDYMRLYGMGTGVNLQASNIMQGTPVPNVAGQVGMAAGGLMQYLNQPQFGDRDYSYLNRMIETMQSLDPRFGRGSSEYIWGTGTMPESFFPQYGPEGRVPGT